MRRRPWLSRRRPLDDRLAWRDAGWCAVDLELTGLDPRHDEIIAVGAVPIEAGRLRLGECVYSLVRPRRRPRHESVLVHGLRAADLADAPPLPEAIGMLLERLDGRVPVFHTAWVERAFLARPLARRGRTLDAAVDTEWLGRRWLGRQDPALERRLSLAELAGALGQDPEPAHHALGDALTTAHAFIALATRLELTGGMQSVRSLLRASDPERPVRRLG